MTHGRLRRRTEQRLIAGVAGGIADRLNASVGFVRVILGLAILVAPLGHVAYGAAALAIPARGSNRPDWDSIIGVARLTVVFGVPVLAFAGGINIGEPFDGPLGWWLAYCGLLVVGAVALLAADYARDHPRARAEARAAVLAALPTGACAVAFAAAVILAPDVRWERVAPAVALVAAACLLLGARRGRTAPFVGPAMLSIAIAGLVVASDMRLQGGIGDKHVSPAPADSTPIVARRAVGDLHMDLRQVTRGGRDATVEASVGVGSIQVELPRRSRVVLDARVAKGQINAFALAESSIQGFDRRVTSSAHPRRGGPGLPTIRLDARVGLGTIDISGGGDLVRDDR